MSKCLRMFCECKKRPHLRELIHDRDRAQDEVRIVDREFADAVIYYIEHDQSTEELERSLDEIVKWATKRGIR